MSILPKIAVISFIHVSLLSGCSSENPAPDTGDYFSYRTRANLVFPVKGESFIGACVRAIEQNHHITEKDQRYALGIVSLEVGSSVPTSNEVQSGRKLYCNRSWE